MFNKGFAKVANSVKIEKDLYKRLVAAKQIRPNKSLILKIKGNK